MTNNLESLERSVIRSSVMSRPSEPVVMGGALKWGITGHATVRRILSNRMLCDGGPGVDVRQAA